MPCYTGPVRQPVEGARYYVASPASESWVYDFRHHPESSSMIPYERGMVFRTREEAIEAAKRMSDGLR